MFYVSQQFLVKLIQTVNDPQADLMRRTGHRAVLVLVVFKSFPIVKL